MKNFVMLTKSGELCIAARVKFVEDCIKSEVFDGYNVSFTFNGEGFDGWVIWSPELVIAQYMDDKIATKYLTNLGEL